MMPARALGFLVLAGSCAAQTILPQIADGGNWRTAIQLVNTTTSAAAVSLNFFQDMAGGATQPWNPPFLEMGSTQNISIAAGGTVYLHTPGTAAGLSQGWGQVAGPLGIVSYAVYTYESFAGRPDQDGTSQAVMPASRILVPFDNTPGFVTSLAIVNPTNSAEIVSVNIETDAGVITSASLPSLPPNGQMAFLTAQQIPATAGHRGVAEFYLSGGAMAIAAFRFNPTLALTSIPVIGATGAPVIGSTATPGPAFINLSSGPTWQPVGAASGVITVIVTPNSDGTLNAQVAGNIMSGAPLAFSMRGSATNQGQNFAFDKVLPGIIAPTSASLNFTLAQATRSGMYANGFLSGTLSVQLGGIAGGGLSLTGPMNGQYVQQFAP